MRSSITEHSFHGIHTSRLRIQARSVTHVSGTKCHPCLRPLNCPRKTPRLAKSLSQLQRRDLVLERSQLPRFRITLNVTGFCRERAGGYMCCASVRLPTG